MKKIILLTAIIAFSTATNSQGRKFIREKIQEWGSCKNVAMTLRGGDIALNGRNGWAGVGLPTAMTDRLSLFNQRDELIDDVVLTENGSWLILWGNNGVSSYGIPISLDNKIKEWNNENEVIFSITFNDNDDWIMISKSKFTASSNKILDWLKEGSEKYGMLWAAHLTNTGLVAIYEKGYRFFGDVPSDLRQKLNETKLDVFRLQFLNDGSYFIADMKGNYDYKM